ncbi:polycystic kidney disease protein-2 [Chrysochromulina tobinii]|uniref:Polycystic kidney disease protein-2 n=1 Tax=Chrysochromulina tobinii TaxID=1460289 RepID=A0A0M0JXV3_9EUKA|nr:polycystic kidney disease protein-2 [Chrysochromulina tobinii]|eukprot:KOO31405.1 polycystic kidney disease protein-2 [Chrysochromulina sp. CCMP291]
MADGAQGIWGRQHGHGLARLANAGGLVAAAAASKKGGSMVPLVKHATKKAKIAKPPDATALPAARAAAERLAARNKRIQKVALFSPRSGKPTNDPVLLKRVFQTFDRDGTGAVSLAEMAAMLRVLKIRITQRELDRICKSVDDGSGELDFEEFYRALQMIRNLQVTESLFDKVMNFVNTVGFQTILYISYVLVFQEFAGTVRTKEEYYVHKAVTDTLLARPFGHNHLTFMQIKRIGDIYKWGDQVLWPGLFGGMGPCNASVGVRDTLANKRCQDDAWPDGEGPLSMYPKQTPTNNMRGPTPADLFELVRRMDKLDWSEGITFRVARTRDQPCDPDLPWPRTMRPRLRTERYVPGNVTFVEPPCPPELGFGTGSAVPYGVNFSHPGEPMVHPFYWYSATELGADPRGLSSANLVALTREPYESAGYVALVIPFFSDVLLPNQVGSFEEVEDFRTSAVNATNDRHVRYYCVRLSHNGAQVRQLCDPTSNLRTNDGELTGVVRAAVEELWGDLRRGHYLDALSRVLTITLQFNSNHVGVRYRLTLVLELTSLGTVLPSYHIETMATHPQKLEDLSFYSRVSLFTVVMFVLLELVRMARMGQKGFANLLNYFTDMWNFADWLNFLIFGLTYWQVLIVERLLKARDCEGSYLCRELGYFDDWQLMGEYRWLKELFSFNLCVQLLKVAKYSSALIPKMSIATDTLRHAMVDMLFFALTVGITIFSFSSLLWVILGPVVNDFYDQVPAMISVMSAFFIDFDFVEAMQRSSGYFSVILMLCYLFVAVFILLTLFLSILAEAQVKVRLDMLEQEANDPAFSSFGTLADLWMVFEKGVDRILKEFEVKNPWPDTPPESEDEAEVTPRGALGLDYDPPHDWEAVGDLRNDVSVLHGGLDQLGSLVFGTVDQLDEQKRLEALAVAARRAARAAERAAIEREAAEAATEERAAFQRRRRRGEVGVESEEVHAAAEEAAEKAAAAAREKAEARLAATHRGVAASIVESLLDATIAAVQARAARRAREATAHEANDELRRARELMRSLAERHLATLDRLEQRFFADDFTRRKEQWRKLQMHRQALASEGDEAKEELERLDAQSIRAEDRLDKLDRWQHRHSGLLRASAAVEVHADGTYDVKVPGVGLHQRVPHADLRLRDGGGMLPILALERTVPVAIRE